MENKFRRLFYKKAAEVFLKPFSRWYFSKPREYRFKNIKGLVLPGVFHPHFTISTKVLLNFLEAKNLEGKTFLELGCGLGIISVQAAMKGAEVVASDINPRAIENVSLNAKKNDVSILAVESDLFERISPCLFDFIVINPPYYPKDPVSDAEKAWFCGSDFDYFKNLFESLGDYFNKKSTVILILSEDCEIEKISAIALEKEIEFHRLQEESKWGETSYIFQLKRT